LGIQKDNLRNVIKCLAQSNFSCTLFIRWYITAVTYVLVYLSLFRDLLNQGLAAPLVLPGSDNYDSILCALVADLDFDGQNEILLGSYGQVCSTYMFMVLRQWYT